MYVVLLGKCSRDAAHLSMSSSSAVNERGSLPNREYGNVKVYHAVSAYWRLLALSVGMSTTTSQTASLVVVGELE